MKSYLLNALRSFTTNRCTHTSINGRRCRQPACPSDPNFCFTHIPKPVAAPDLDAQLTAELHAASANLDTPANVLVLLSKIVIAANHNQLELRRARFLIAACNAILRAQRQILQLKKLESQIPNPDRDSGVFDIPPAHRNTVPQHVTDFLDAIPRPIRDEPYIPPSTTSPTADASAPPTNEATSAQPAATNHSLSTDASPTTAHSSPNNFPAHDSKSNRFPPPGSAEEIAQNLKANLKVTLHRKPKPVEPNPFYFPTATPEPPLPSSDDFSAENSPNDPLATTATQSTTNSSSLTSRLISKAKSHFQSNRSESSTKSSTKTSATKSPKPEQIPATNPEFFRHFYPYDPTLPQSMQAMQDPMNTVPPELRKRARYSDLYHYRFNPKPNPDPLP